MRVTDQQIFSSTQYDVLNARDRFYQKQRTVASGRNINAPSEDPMGMRNIMACEHSLACIEMYERNISYGMSRIKTAEDSLALCDEALSEARKVAFSQNSQHFDQGTRDAAIRLVEELYDQMMDMANTRLGENFIFAGHNSRTKPFARDDDYNITSLADDGKVGLRISEQNIVNLNADGEQIFQIDDPGGGPPISMFDMLRDLRSALQNDDQAGIRTQIDHLADAQYQLQTVRAVNNAQYKHLEMTERHHAKVKANVESKLADIQKADMTTAVLELQMEQTAYEAALVAASKIFQQSLLDFLR